MINPIRLFTSFEGRIGRRAYRLGLAGLIAVNPFSVRTILSSNPFTEAIGAIRDLGLAGLVWTVALLVPLAALNTKRLHDLGRTGWIGLLFYAPALLSSLTLFTGWTPEFGAVIGWTTFIAGLLGAAGIFFLVRLGFKRGTQGPNRYGPPPGSRTVRAADA